MATIPKFKSEEEIQEFWATHDSADYWDDMADDEVEISFVPRKHLLVMPLNENILHDVRELALEKGTSSAQLLRKWIVAGLQQESSAT
ncbi:MAG: CopG family antitoxin [Candidatus Poribacteria bacterium]|nr:CopG family antitoxin [Candidatus Poribacteria bacterium]